MIVTKTGLDSATFESVTLVKEVAFSPVGSVQDALAQLGNDNAALLAIVNSGLQERAREAARESDSPWHTFVVDENGEILKENGQPKINGVFSGKLVDPDKLASIVLPMAKLAKGEDGKALWPEPGTADSAERKRIAKNKAMEMLKANPAILAALGA